MWLLFTPDEFKDIQKRLLDAGLDLLAKQLRQNAYDYFEGNRQRQKFVAEAEARYHYDYQTQVFLDAAISQTDEGAHVLAWVWVSNEDAGIPAAGHRDADTECQNCGLPWREQDLDEVVDIEQRVDVGEVAPVGECPDCGAVCHYLDEARQTLYTG
jgi:hypothetical protein